MITLGLFEEHKLKGILVLPFSLLLDILFLPFNLMCLGIYVVNKVRKGK